MSADQKQFFGRGEGGDVDLTKEDILEHEQRRKEAKRADQISTLKHYSTWAAAMVGITLLLGLLGFGCVAFIKAVQGPTNPDHVLVVSKGTRPEARYKRNCTTSVRINFEGKLETYQNCRSVFSHYEDVSSYVWAGCTTDAGGAKVPLTRSGDYKISQLISEGKTSDGEFRCSGRVIVAEKDLPDIEKMTWRTFKKPES